MNVVTTTHHLTAGSNPSVHPSGRHLAGANSRMRSLVTASSRFPASASSCWFCAQPTQPGAQFCSGCGRVALTGCLAVMRTSKSYVLGRFAGGGFAIWDQTDTLPVSEYPENDWVQANDDLDKVEAGPAVRSAKMPSRSKEIAGSIALALFIVGIYVWWHSHRYSGCYIRPDII